MCANVNKEQLALQAIDLGKASILTDNHFLASAIGRLALEPKLLSAPLATDGFLLAFDTTRVINAFRTAKQPPTHDLMHTVAHCLFLHPYIGTSAERRLWDLACDIVAERIVAELLGPRPGSQGMACRQVIDQVERGLGRRTGAERIYRALRDGRWRESIALWASTMKSDSHELWYGSASSGDHSQGQGNANAEGTAEASDQGRPEQLSRRPSAAAQQASWRSTATSLAVNLQTLSSGRGDELAELVDDLRAASQSKTDYSTFLRRFATPGEALRTNDDEFDQIFYTYGLALYKNLPLVEPLEYREEQRVREFVIVLDTSESVQGDTLRSFVETTFDLLASTESFFEHVHLRVIQCDEQVRSDQVLTSAADVESWGQTMRVSGGGGTDFRPAFSYVDQLVEAGAFWNLGGLVYFTDGLGTYPDWVPRYRSAFVFYDEDYPADCVPPWAYQVVLDRDELRHLANMRSRRKEAVL